MKKIAKYLVFSFAMLFSGVSFADAQLETLNLRVAQQSNYVTAALAQKVSGDELKKIKKEVNDHVDMFAPGFGDDSHVDVLVGSTDESAVYRNIRKLTFLKTYLSRYYSAGEVQTILINTNLIATFGRDKLNK